MELAIEKLKEAEVVQMNKIKRMKDGKPKWRAEDQLDEIRSALHILQSINTGKSNIVTAAEQHY